MSLLDRIAPTSQRTSDDRGTPPYAIAFGSGALAPVAFTLLLFVPVLASWTLDPRTSTEWSNALAIASSAFGLSLRGSISVPHNGIEALHLAPMVATALLVVITRFAYRPVQHALDDSDAAGEEQQRTSIAFGLGFLVSTLAAGAVSHIGPAPVRLWTLLPGVVVVVLAGVAWSIRRDGEGVRLPWLEAAAERLHLNVRRAVRPAAEGLGVLFTTGALLVFLLVMMRLDRVGKVETLLDVSGSGVALLWFAQLLIVPNLILFGVGWMTGAPLALGAGNLSTGSAEATILPSVPLLGALPEPGPLAAFFHAVLLVPVLVGAFIGWRATASMPTLTHIGRKVQVAASAAGVATVGLAVLLWFSRAGMSPGQLDLIGPAWTSVVYGAVELALGACLAATALHFWRRFR